MALQEPVRSDTQPMVEFVRGIMDSIREEQIEHENDVYCEVCGLWYDKEDTCEYH